METPFKIEFEVLGKKFKVKIKAENEAIARAKLLKEIENRVVIKKIEPDSDKMVDDFINKVFGGK